MSSLEAPVQCNPEAGLRGGSHATLSPLFGVFRVYMRASHAIILCPITRTWPVWVHAAGLTRWAVDDAAEAIKLAAVAAAVKGGVARIPGDQAAHCRAGQEV